MLYVSSKCDAGIFVSTGYARGYIRRVEVLDSKILGTEYMYRSISSLTDTYVIRSDASTIPMSPRSFGPPCVGYSSSLLYHIRCFPARSRLYDVFTPLSTNLHHDLPYFLPVAPSHDVCPAGTGNGPFAANGNCGVPSCELNVNCCVLTVR